MSDTIYRPLIVMVEAVEAAARAKLEIAQNTPVTEPPEPRGPSMLRALQRILKRERYPDVQFDFTRSAWSDDICVGFLCSYCDMPHRDYVDGRAFVMADRSGIINLFIDKLDEMIAKPCAEPVRGLDLGPAGLQVPERPPAK